MVVVLAILLIAGAAVMPTLQSLWGATPINAAADTVKARMAHARARAIAENRPYRFDVMDNTGTMRVAPDSAEFWDGVGDEDSDSTMVSTTDGTGPAPLVMRDRLPNEIRFCGSQTLGTNGQAQQSAGGGSWVCPVVFLPDGTTRQDAEIAFTEAGHRPFVLRVQAATGAITTGN